MALQLAAATRNALTAQMVTDFAGGTLKFFSGSVPANCAASDPSGLLASGTLPSPALTSSAGVTTLAGTWTITGSAGGTAASFRVYNSGSTCVCQGTVTATGGGGDLTLDNTSIANTQVITEITFAVTAGNA
jgi:hypothetical protein